MRPIPRKTAWSFPTSPPPKCAAIKRAGTIICDEAETFWDRTEWTMTVSAPEGLTLFQIHIVGIDAPAIRGG